jgi:polysaccharide export outer membrane protein
MPFPKKWNPLSSLILAALLGCSSMGQYVWVDSLPDSTSSPGEYVLAPGDTINVRVFNQESISGRTRVRPDGRVTIPFLNDVPAAGRTTEELAKSLQTMLRDFVKQAVVTVSLEEAAQTQLSVLGEVAKPGVYSIDRTSQGVLRALAAAGGFTDFAHKDRIFVVRAGAPEKIRFTFDSLSTPNSKSAKFRLQNDDVVVVQ